MKVMINVVQINMKKINSPAQYKCVGSGKLERNQPSLELQGPVEEKLFFYFFIIKQK